MMRAKNATLWGSSFSDIFENLHFGALGHFEARKDRWGFGTNLMYMDLHAPRAWFAYAW